MAKVADTVRRPDDTCTRTSKSSFPAFAPLLSILYHPQSSDLHEQEKGAPPASGGADATDVACQWEPNRKRLPSETGWCAEKGSPPT